MTDRSVTRKTARELVEAHRTELEAAVLERMQAISEPPVGHPSYREGLRESVAVAIDYALEAIERGEERIPSPPPALLAQARRAARSGVGLDTVLRRYLAGYTLLGDLFRREVEKGSIPSSSVAALVPGRAAIFDRLIAAITDEYNRERHVRPDSSDRRRAERVKRLLAGEPLDLSDFNYEFGVFHVGLLAAGPRAAETVRELATALDCRLLLVREDQEEAICGWLGTHRRLDTWEIQRGLVASGPVRLDIAIGEPAAGLRGWRLTHRQAAAALAVAQRQGESVVRYADVAVVASAIQDELLANSLRQLYMVPLLQEAGGEVLCETLRAYFDAERNVSAAAAILGISRQAVSARLATIEKKLGQPIAHRAGDIELALRLHGLDRVTNCNRTGLRIGTLQATPQGR